MTIAEKTKNVRPTHRFILMMLCCVIVWAFAFPFISLALEDLSFTNLTLMRFFVVCIILLTILAIQPKKFSKLHKKDIVPIFLLGFFGVMIYHLALNYGEQYISPGAASLIIATSPIFTIILSVFLLSETFTKKKILGTIFALSGVIIISMWGKQGENLEIKYLVAALAVVVSSIASAAYTIAGKPLLKRYTPLSLVSYAMLLGSLGLLPILLFDMSIFSQAATMSLPTIGAILFLGVFSTVIGYVIWYVALEMRTASEISIYLYSIPVFSTIISYFLFGYMITILFVFGGVLVVIGLILVNLKEKSKNQLKSKKG